MANAVFSPRDFKAFVIEEATTGTSPAITASLFQLDVDSISFPSLNVNQVTNVRGSTGRVAHINDFFQDNDMRTVEVSLSGTWHNDAGHGMLLQSVAGATLAGSAASVSVGTAASTKAGKYGTTEGEKTFTLVLASPDQTDGNNILVKGCLCTNFTLNADMGTDGGQYKWSCTIFSGRVPELDNTDAPGVGSGGGVYGGTHVDMAGIDVSEIRVFSTTPVLSSFSVTIDSPAVFTGVAEGAGYACFGRSEEIAITASATVKLDSDTRGLVNSFDTQVTHDNADLFTINQTTDAVTSVAIPCGILTNVAYNEGDAMMLDVEMKALNNGSDAPIAFTLA
jgi:hypothetical protein